MAFPPTSKASRKVIKGEVYGRWTVQETAFGVLNKALCICTCGRSKIVNVRCLLRGSSTSCGCAHYKENDKSVAWGYKTRWSRYVRAASEKNRDWGLSFEQFKVLIDSSCFYCNEPGPGGIDRIDSNNGYITGNVCSCCSICNRMKSFFKKDIFLEKIEKIYKNFILK